MSLVHGDGPIPARIMIVGEAPGEEEERHGKPFVGRSGEELSRMLHEAGINRSDCFITNVCRQRPPQNDISNFVPEAKKDVTADMVLMRDRYVKPIVVEGYNTLLKELELVKPNVIIAFGNVAMWGLTGHWGITKWRGSVLETSLGWKLIPMIHPAAILRQWEWRFITVHDLRRAESESKFSEVRYPPYKFLVRPQFSEAMEVLNVLTEELSLGPRTLSVDIETRRGYCACVGIAWSRFEAICLPFMCTERAEGYWTLDEELAIRRSLRQLLTHPNARVVGQYFLYDAQYFWNEDRYVPSVAADTIIKHHVLFPGTPRNLSYQSSLYCDFHRHWKDEGKEWVPSMPEEQHWAYNCKDAVITFEVNEHQDRALEQTGLVEVANFQQQLFWPVLQMMLKGIRLNQSLRPPLARELTILYDDRLAYLARLLGHPLNPKSPKQMHALFYNDFNMKPILHRKSKKPTLDDEAMQKLAIREPIMRPLFNAIADARTLGVFKSTFIDSELDPDGRMRCSYDITGAETFRFSSSESAFGRGMNLQNIPSDKSKSIQKAKSRGSEFVLPDIRKLFIPDPGFRFFDVDLDRADLQVVVWEADDKLLKAMLKDGADIHSENAKLLGIHRELAKVFCHGTNYGGSARTMSAHIGASVHITEQMQKRWFSAHPGILTWHGRIEEELMTKRYVSNKFGYRIFYFDRVETLLPEALAWIPQSTVACVINRVLLRIAVELPEVDLLLQVHDSLSGQFPDSLTGQLIPKILERARIEIPYDDPLIIPVSVKTSTVSWGDCQ